MKPSSSFRLGILLFLLFQTACTAVSTSNDTVSTTIKLGYIPYSSYLVFYIAEQEGYFEEQDLNVELVKFGTQADAIPLLVSGDIDVYGGTLDTMVMNAIAQGGVVKIVADKGYDNPEGCVYTAWVARQDLFESGVLDDLSNIEGMNIAFPLGQNPEYGLDVLLEPAGLSSADINMVDVSAPNRVAGLENGSIDIAFLSEPFISQVVNSGSGSIWKAWETYMPEFQLAVTMYGSTILKDNIEAGQRFMVAYLQAVRQYMEGKTARNVELMAEFLNSTEEQVMQSCWQSLRTDGTIDVQSVLDYVEWAVEKGYQVQVLEMEDFWEPSFIEYANDFLE